MQKSIYEVTKYSRKVAIIFSVAGTQIRSHFSWCISTGAQPSFLPGSDMHFAHELNSHAQSGLLLDSSLAIPCRQIYYFSYNSFIIHYNLRKSYIGSKKSTL